MYFNLSLFDITRITFQTYEYSKIEPNIAAVSMAES